MVRLLAVRKLQRVQKLKEILQFLSQAEGVRIAYTLNIALFYLVTLNRLIMFLTVRLKSSLRGICSRYPSLPSLQTQKAQVRVRNTLHQRQLQVVCLSVCLSVRRITHKLVDEFSRIFLEWRHV